MHYYAKIRKSDGVFLVSFPEFKHINTYGDTVASAINNAEEALNGAIESDFERGFSLPQQKEHPGKSFHKIPIQPHLEIAYSLRKIRNQKTQSEVAKALGISYQAYQKLENPRKCNPTIKTLEKISYVLGKKLEVVFS
jgi:antitoxin HicB